MTKDLCVRCGKPTIYDINTPITLRRYFVEGTLQNIPCGLCCDLHACASLRDPARQDGEVRTTDGTFLPVGVSVGVKQTYRLVDANL